MFGWIECRYPPFEDFERGFHISTWPRLVVEQTNHDASQGIDGQLVPLHINEAAQELSIRRLSRHDPKKFSFDKKLHGGHDKLKMRIKLNRTFNISRIIDVSF